METVYERHDRTFRWMTAVALCDDDGKLVGFVTMHEDRDGAAPTRAWVQLLGSAMVEGSAEAAPSQWTGTAAVRDAISRMEPYGSRQYETPETAYGKGMVALFSSMKAAAGEMDAVQWTHALARHGFRLSHAM